jgi:ATP-dependent helicase YprA (DUF1998 family)
VIAVANNCAGPPHVVQSFAAFSKIPANGTLHSATGSIFSIDGEPLSLYRHQAQAVAKAATKQSFVVTTGTGSGKSLCFFIPVIEQQLAQASASSPELRSEPILCSA